MNKSVQLFRPHSGQQKIIDEFVTTDNLTPNEGEKNKCHWGIVVTGRQFGKTLLGMNSMAYWLLNNPGTVGVWASPYNQQGDAVYDELVVEIKPLLQSFNSQSKKVVFKNGSTLLFRSLENYEAFRGYTFDYGVIDECAFVREEAWKVVRPTFAVHGKKVMVISTPWVKNTFYDMYCLGLDESNDQFTSFKAPSIANPYFPYSEIEASRAILPEETVQQEYYAEFGEAGGGVFTGFGDYCKIDKFYGDYREERCYLGGDIALGGKDWTCIVVINQSGEVINIERWRDSITSRQISRINAIVDSYNIAGGYIELNQERGISQAVERHNRMVKPWETTRKNKPLLIQGLKKAIEDGTISLPSKNAGPDAVAMIKELGDFTKEAKNNGYIAYSHPPGGHDDTVIALALAEEARTMRVTPKWTPRTGVRFKT